ncbi:MAG: hypothetical protein H8E55_11160 [Pelagibacterales bacterium]|jgi:hypothetical protein|nr:hypothetical protein [Pelagibacterales bacterium]
MKFNIGDIVEFIMKIPINDYQSSIAEHLRSYKDVKETGIVVGKGNEFSDRLCISIKRYGGDYKIMEMSKVKKKVIPIEYKLSLVSSFGPWWSNYHKVLYQSILIEAIPKKL